MTQPYPHEKIEKNVGLLFALAEFVVAWLIAFYYPRRAGSEFDRLAREIAADYEKGKVTP